MRIINVDDTITPIYNALVKQHETIYPSNTLHATPAGFLRQLRGLLEDRVPQGVVFYMKATEIKPGPGATIEMKSLHVTREQIIDFYQRVQDPR